MNYGDLVSAPSSVAFSNERPKPNNVKVIVNGLVKISTVVIVAGGVVVATATRTANTNPNPNPFIAPSESFETFQTTIKSLLPSDNHR